MVLTVRTDTSRVRKLLGRDLWNLLIRNVWSRRVRRVWSRQVLKIESDAVICLGVRLLGPEGIKVGARSVVNRDCTLDGRGGLSVGDDVDIAPEVQIWTLEHDPNDAAHATRSGAVHIGDHVWIASRAIILPGTQIGRGAVIAAGAVVNHDVPERAIVAGVPARIIGTRDNPLKYKLSFAGRFR